MGFYSEKFADLVKLILIFGVQNCIMVILQKVVEKYWAKQIGGGDYARN